MLTGSGASSSPSIIRMFIRAGSPEELVRLQLKTNLAVKGQASFTDIQFVKGKWYAWFLVDVNKHQDILEVINGTSDGSV